MLTIQLNGESREIRAGITVSDLLADLERDPRTVAVELNGTVLERQRLSQVRLAEGDRVEIVQFVQGGA